MNTQKISVLWLHSLLWLVMCPLAVADTYTVTHTGDSGPGSLRLAMLDAASHIGEDTIVFNIPVTDGNYNAAVGSWTIQPQSPLPDVTDDATTIDGTSQAAFIGSDPNPDGPEIELDGSMAGEHAGIYVLSGHNVITCLTINRFLWFGIEITYSNADHNLVTGCYVGTDPTGSVDLGNGFTGIMLYNGPSQNIIGGTIPAERNVCSGNGWSGIEIQSGEADSNFVIGNYIGTDATGMFNLGNERDGIEIWSGPAYNVVGGAGAGEANLISGNDWSGVTIGSNSDHNRVIGNLIGVDTLGSTAIPNEQNGIIVGGNHCTVGGTEPGEGNIIAGGSNWGMTISGTNNTIAGNIIGTDAGGTFDLGHYFSGVQFHYGAQNNVLGPDNHITFNDDHGVLVLDDTTVGNTITRNSISGNSNQGIDNQNGGNTELPPPTIALDGPDTYSGTAPPSSIVEIFSDSEDEGMFYEGTAMANGTGFFSWTGTPVGPHITATATDAAGNTSEFSVPYAITAVEDELPAGLPDRFLLAQNHPNPFNPQTSITYHLPTACQVDVSVFDTAGRQVMTLVSTWQEAGQHSVEWMPADGSVGSGVYFYRIAAGDFTTVRKAVLLK